jgi:magnesium-transporting ATPase (P-type)
LLAHNTPPTSNKQQTPPTCEKKTQAAFCLLAFFAVFWWHHVPLSWIYNTGTSQWTRNSRPIEGWRCDDAGGCRALDGETQERIYWEAQAAWYVTLVMCQFWHIFTVRALVVNGVGVFCGVWAVGFFPRGAGTRDLRGSSTPGQPVHTPLTQQQTNPPSHNKQQCKTRQVSLFQHGPFKNPVTLFGVAVSFTVILLVTYVPFLQPIFTTAALNGTGWLPQLGFLIFIVLYTELGKRRARRDPDGAWARRMMW